MELALTPEQEALPVEMAAQEGKTPSQFVVDAMSHLSDADRYFRERIHRGIAEPDAGVFIEEEEMDIRFEKMIRG
jgi:predicted transcriptional regulator